MFTVKSVKRLAGRRPRFLLGLAVLLVMAAPAVAAQMETWTVLIGSPANDVFNESGQAGNFRIYGLGGFNAEAGGKGDNWLVGNGHCPSSKYNTKGYDNASGEWDAYCDTGQISGAPGAVLVGGGGVNTIFGSGGPNVIVAGPDVPSTGSGNYIYGGPVADLIAAQQGSSTIYPGAGTNYIDARSPAVDDIYCVKGDRNTTVYAEHYDVIVNCAHVYYSNPPSIPSAAPALSAASLTQAQALIRAGTSSAHSVRRSGHHHARRRHERRPRAHRRG